MQIRTSAFRAFPFALSLLAWPAIAQTITVNTSSEVIDFANPQQVANLPGPDGKVSLHEAVAAANNTPGPQTIVFAIPRAEWEENLFPGVAMVQYSNLLILLSGDNTTIDFTTQRDFTGDTNPNGNEVGLHYSGPPSNIPFIYVTANNCTIKGLGPTYGNAFGASIFITGNNNHVIGCNTSSVEIDAYDGQATSNTVGGAAPEEGNTLLSVRLDSGASGNSIFGNQLRSVQILGDSLYGPCDNNRIGGPTPAERNTISGNGRSGQEGLPYGIQIELQTARHTVIENNYIGTTPDGLAESLIRNGTAGISVGNACVDTLIKDNLVSGIERTGSNHYQGQRFGTAIVVMGNAADTRLFGNRIGLASDGVSPIPNVSGVQFSTATALDAGPTAIRFGSAAPGEGNIVANSEAYGLFCNYHTAGARISGNSFYNNNGLAVDLATAGNAAGVSLNDASDADTGGNNQQNFPVLTSASISGSLVSMSGSLSSLPSQTYTIEFFASPSCDSSGFGEGQFFLGSIQTVIPAGGTTNFQASIPTSGLAAGMSITATATRESTGDTSEFSACITLDGASECPADLDDGSGIGSPDGAVTIDDLLYFVSAFEAGSPAADLDNDGDPALATPDGAVTIDDLLFFLARFEAGC